MADLTFKFDVDVEKIRAEMKRQSEGGSPLQVQDGAYLLGTPVRTSDEQREAREKFRRDAMNKLGEKLQHKAVSIVSIVSIDKSRGKSDFATFAAGQLVETDPLRGKAAEATKWLVKYINETTHVVQLAEPLDFIKMDFEVTAPGSACECGAHKTHRAEKGSALHSSWCPESKP